MLWPAFLDKRGYDAQREGAAPSFLKVNMIKKITHWSLLTMASAVLLTGCGSSQPGRTSGGVATGAGTGAAIGIIGGPIGVVVGAAVGAGAGALTATNTTPQQVNLGDPLWQRNEGVTSNSSLATPQPTGSLPPPQPLTQPVYTPPGGAPSPGAQPMPQSAPIQSQDLSPAQPQAAYRPAVPVQNGGQSPTPLTPPPPAQNYQYQAQ
ncbi:hypothetical protein Acid7E03_21630 [Acidisoma sp. 7E03]